MSEKPDIAIVGPGRVGTALGICAARAGYIVTTVAGRNAANTRQAAADIGAPAAPADLDAVNLTEGLVFLTVPDDAIGPVCRQLVRRSAIAGRSTIVHCSGALGSSVLQPAADLGCPVASMHPLQTFPDAASGAEKLADAFIFCQGDQAALELLLPLAERIARKVKVVSAEGKTLYHAAAVTACNYLVGLLDASLATAELAGIDRATAWEALEPLVRATVDNTARIGTESALTGPVARGDVQTLANHLSALSDAPAALQRLYRAAGAWTAELAGRKGTIDRDRREQILQLLAKEAKD
ncbi:MAG: Rossmann-like and DUF2520 domain-containing protein [Phycisphaerae bacterium]